MIVVPLQNPWGFDNRTRYNSNGVDLNRNYDYGWEKENSTVKGTAPFSEKETQYMRDLIQMNKDAIHFIDYHTISTSGRPDDVLQDIRVNAGGEGIYIANHSIGKKTIAMALETGTLETEHEQARLGLNGLYMHLLYINEFTINNENVLY